MKYRYMFMQNETFNISPSNEMYTSVLTANEFERNTEYFVQ